MTRQDEDLERQQGQLHARHHSSLALLPPSSPPPEPQQQDYVPSPYELTTALPAYKSKASSTAEIENVVVLERSVTRTPSPSPSETAFLNRSGFFDWQRMKNWRYWFRKEWLWRYVILGIVVVFAVLIAVYDKKIVHALEPVGRQLRDMPAGWLIPIAIMFVISFPPLFGHEIVAMLCGVIWGFWIGFGITAAGTLLGEIGNFYAFRYCCQARGNKYEKTNLHYGCLARVVRQGSFKVVLIARYSAVPGHMLTAVFSTCGMNIFVFALSATLSLPKQAALVFIGVALEKDGTGQESPADSIVSAIVGTVTSIVTIIAMRYIYRKMDGVKNEVVYARRKSRQMKLDRRNSIDSSPASDLSVPQVSAQLHIPTPSRTSPPFVTTHGRPILDVEDYSEYPLSNINRV